MLADVDLPATVAVSVRASHLVVPGVRSLTATGELILGTGSGVP